jgi:hypothetical protein
MNFSFQTKLPPEPRKSHSSSHEQEYIEKLLKNHEHSRIYPIRWIPPSVPISPFSTFLALAKDLLYAIILLSIIFFPLALYFYKFGF